MQGILFCIMQKTQQVRHYKSCNTFKPGQYKQTGHSGEIGLIFLSSPEKSPLLIFSNPRLIEY